MLLLRALLGSRADGSQTSQAIPDDVAATQIPLPSLYERLWDDGVRALGPWTLLEGDAFLQAQAALERQPVADAGAYTWLPFARREPDGLLACVQAIPLDPRVRLVRLGVTVEVTGELERFADWLRWAVDDLIRADAGETSAAPGSPPPATPVLERPSEPPPLPFERPDVGEDSQSATRRHLLRMLHHSDVDLDFVTAEAGDQHLTSPALRRHHEQVKRRRGDRIFADMMFVLTQQRYPARMAKWLWGRIVEHKRDMSARLGREIEVTVASLDFLNGHEHLVEGSLVLCSEDELAQIAEVALRDGLTGLFDQASFRERLRRELRRAQRYDSPVSVLLVDIDHFKRINDTHGHPVGDRVLADLGELLRVSLRDADIAARYGGEEFALCLPETDPVEAQRLGDRLRDQVKARFPDTPRVTISVGVASYPEDGDQTQTLIERADAALYHAKRSGRDRTSSARHVRGAKPEGCEASVEA